MVSGFGENEAITLSDRRVAAEVREKNAVIVRYWSSKSTTLDMRMMLDLEEPRSDG